MSGRELLLTLQGDFKFLSSDWDSFKSNIMDQSRIRDALPNGTRYSENLPFQPNRLSGHR